MESMPASRLSRLIVLIACACALSAAAAPLASAGRAQSAGVLDPVIAGLKLLGAAGVGNPVAVDLHANDAVAAIEGVEVDFGDGLGRTAESACYASSSTSKPSPFNIDNTSRF